MYRRIAYMLLLLIVATTAISCGSEVNTQTKPAEQPANPLPAEHRAEQTVTQFLELCKQGRAQEAVGRYGTGGLLIYPPTSIGIEPLGLETLADYTVGSILTITQDSSRFIAVLANLKTRLGLLDASSKDVIYEVTADGNRIIRGDGLGIRLTPANQASLMAASFLDMCHEGRVQEALDKYMELPADALSPHFRWKDAMSSLFNNVLYYRVEGASLDNYYNIWLGLALAVESGGFVSQENVLFPCIPDGSQVAGNRPLIVEGSAMPWATLTAVETVAGFLSSCKKGYYKQAAQEYLPPEDVPQPNKIAPFQSVFEDLSGYSMFGQWLDSGGVDSPEPGIDFYIRSKSGSTTSVRFICNEEGSPIQKILELSPPPPDEDVWSDSPDN